MIRALAVLTLLVVLALLEPERADACSPIQPLPTVTERAERADIVFFGKVAGVERDGGQAQRDIPSALGDLALLEQVRLAGTNTLTGCIPVALEPDHRASGLTLVAGRAIG